MSRTTSVFLGTVFLLSMALATGSALGQVEIEKRKLTADDGAVADFFGYSVSADGYTVAVGAPRNRAPGPPTGAVYVFRYNGFAWREQQLLASDARGGDWFGKSVALSGDLLVVGADHDDTMGTNSGAAYVFRCVNCRWIEDGKLTASDGVAADLFGSSVAVDGSVIVVGAQDDDNLQNSTGSAYVFRFNGIRWVEEQKLLASDYAAWDKFGGSVSISGEVIVAGARQDDSNGAAYVFRHDGNIWIEEQKLIAHYPHWHDEFGTSVSVSENVIAVGAPGHDDPRDSGRAYLFRHDGSNWVEEQMVSAVFPATGNHFGFSVSVERNVAVVGEPDVRGILPSKVFAFRHDDTGWRTSAQLLSNNREQFFGFSVSVGGEVIIAGAYGDDNHGGVDAGAATTFWAEGNRTPCSWGSVNARNRRVPCLRVNRSDGHCVAVEIGNPIEISMDPSPVGPEPARFVLYAWDGEPDATTVSVQPYGIGTACMPTFLSIGIPKPDWIWNNLGYPSYLGAPNFPSYAAPTIVAASPAGFHRAITITLQGFLQDFGSAANAPISVTNAVILHVD